MVLMENTHNRCGGVPISVEDTAALAKLAHENELKLHLDGARIFNAAAALNVTARELAGSVDSVTFCLSKGLCAPVGSVLCGTEDCIYEARHIRKQLGGGMRQAGILAAAGIIAIEKMSLRLGEDHQQARKLADGLSAIGGLVIDEGSPRTNMIFANLAADIPIDAPAINDLFKARGILTHETGKRRFRFVTHYWVDDAAVTHILKAWEEIYRSIRK
jgi:threonine aldolase